MAKVYTRVTFRFQSPFLSQKKMQPLLAIHGACFLESPKSNVKTWALDSPLNEEKTLDEHILSLRAILDKYTEAICELAKEIGRPNFFVSSYIFPDEEGCGSCLYLSGETVVFIHSLNADIQIDVMPSED